MNISEEQRTYFELLAEIGHTKHIGGLAATAVHWLPGPASP